MITAADIQVMEKTLTERFDFLKGDTVWIKAFEEYNMQNVNQLSMKCRPCYFKVYKFHLDIFKAVNN